MLAWADAALTGAWAALRTPYALAGERLTPLLREPARSRPGAVPARGSVRVALAAVRWLSRIPGSPWRNTCLYRSVAECLVLRRYGVPALVRIGVKSEGPPPGSIAAHAWVVRADRPAAHDEAHRPLVLRA
jgi:Transglutaminase-like superfamily